MSTLIEQRCKPCEGGAAPLPAGRVRTLLGQLPNWRLTPDRRGIERRFAFDAFSETVAFVNALAWIAQEQGHHPDFTVRGAYCRIRFTTHALDGLSENDFICAARVDRLAARAKER